MLTRLFLKVFKNYRNLLILSLLILTGCASAPKMGQAINFAKTGQYLEAEQEVMKSLPPDGRHKLLHYLEMGMITHLKGEYNRSNQYFNEAERLAEEFYTTSLTASVGEILTGPSLSNYKGFPFENTHINYYKAMNYLATASDANSSAEEIDSALVEIRRLNNRLEQQRLQSGGYKSSKQQELDGDNGMKAKMLDFFAQALGEQPNANKLHYKDDAFGHYLSGLFFELANDKDSARISYQRAAETYRNGYAKQYTLGKQPSQQAWYDVAKIMKLDRDYQWRRISRKHLNNELQQKLSKLKTAPAELIIIQDLGTMPRRKQMNFRMTLDSYSQSLVLEPMPVGSFTDINEQLRWFQMLYADTGVFDIVQNYSVGNIGTVAAGAVSKRIPIGPMWGTVESLNMVKALEYGVRIAVPYYPPLKENFVKTELHINGQAKSLLMTGNAINKIALQEQIRTANREIKASLTRELVKAVAAQKVADEAGPYGGLLKLANFTTASTDTRNWSTLPAEIRFTRIELPEGEHQIELKTYLSNGQMISQHKTVTIRAGKPALWHTRTFEPIGISLASGF